MSGSTSFPGALDTFPTIGPDTPRDAPGVEHDVVHSNVHAALVAVQAKLGTNASADPASVDARLAALEAGAGSVTDYTRITADGDIRVTAGNDLRICR